MELIDKYTNLWNDLLIKYTDKRTKDWFMVQSVIPAALICLLYVLLVSISPYIMKNRKPMDLKNVLIVYNFLMVLLSSYTFYEFLASGWFNDYSFQCQPVDYSNSPKALRMAAVCWIFYMSKFIELFDTLFFILRKKFNQVTFLHVFHHGIMPVSWWFGVRFVPGGFGTFHALLNSFIHVLMYAYYGLSALGPQYQKYLWWKRYMTKMQLIQFVACLIHASQLLFIKCDYPIIFAYWVMSYAIMFFVLFMNFFVQEYYLKKSKKSANVSKEDKIGNSETNGNYKNHTELNGNGKSKAN